MFNTLNMSHVYHLKEGKNLRYLSHKRYRNVGHKHCFCVVSFLYLWRRNHHNCEFQILIVCKNFVKMLSSYLMCTS